MVSRRSFQDRAATSTLTADDLNHLRRLLSALRAETLESCRSLLAEGQGEPEGEASSAGGLPDPVDRSGDPDRALDYLGCAQTQLDEITRALEEMDRATFGRCIECGQAIPLSRLITLPIAVECPACLARKEAELS
jgi:RNA polymerase-binding transcription factor DksA